MAARPIFGDPTQEVSPGGDLTVLTVPVTGDPLSDEAVAAVRDPLAYRWVLLSSPSGSAATSAAGVTLPVGGRWPGSAEA